MIKTTADAVFILIILAMVVVSFAYSLKGMIHD